MATNQIKILGLSIEIAKPWANEVIPLFIGVSPKSISSVFLSD